MSRKRRLRNNEECPVFHCNYNEGYWSGRQFRCASSTCDGALIRRRHVVKRKPLNKTITITHGVRFNACSKCGNAIGQGECMEFYGHPCQKE